MEDNQSLRPEGSTQKGKTVLIVEDDRQIQNLVGYILQREGYRLVQAATASKALNILKEDAVDLVLLDLGLPDLDGQDLLRTLRTFSPVSVLVISARESEQEKVRALDAGADDYLTKPFFAAELLARIRTAFRHAASASDLHQNGILRLCHLTLDPMQRILTTPQKSVTLTPMECELMRILMLHPDRTVTLRTLMGALYHTSSTDDTQVLRTLVASLRRKVEADPARPQFIQTEIGVGYRLCDSR